MEDHKAGSNNSVPDFPRFDVALNFLVPGYFFLLSYLRGKLGFQDTVIITLPFVS